jgi:hypothetical protein
MELPALPSFAATKKNAECVTLATKIVDGVKALYCTYISAMVGMMEEALSLTVTLPSGHPLFVCWKHSCEQVFLSAECREAHQKEYHHGPPPPTTVPISATPAVITVNCGQNHLIDQLQTMIANERQATAAAYREVERLDNALQSMTVRLNTAIAQVNELSTNEVVLRSFLDQSRAAEHNMKIEMQQYVLRDKQMSDHLVAVEAQVKKLGEENPALSQQLEETRAAWTKEAAEFATRCEVGGAAIEDLRKENETLREEVNSARADAAAQLQNYQLAFRQEIDSVVAKRMAELRGTITHNRMAAIKRRVDGSTARPETDSWLYCPIIFSIFGKKHSGEEEARRKVGKGFYDEAVSRFRAQHPTLTWEEVQDSRDVGEHILTSRQNELLEPMQNSAFWLHLAQRGRDSIGEVDDFGSPEATEALERASRVFRQRA